MVVPRIHGHTEEENTEGSPHVDASVNRKRGPEGRANFMQNLASEKDVSTITNDPESNTPGCKYMDDPVRISPLKGLGQI